MLATRSSEDSLSYAMRMSDEFGPLTAVMATGRRGCFFAAGQRVAVPVVALQLPT
jgi:hypothetical protein